MRIMFMVVALLFATGASATEPEIIVGKITRVIDGDTFVMKSSDGPLVRIRLWGIDAPEIGTPEGTYATRIMQVMVRDITTTVACQPKGRSYERIVAKCSAFAGKEWVFFGKAMVAAGAARDFPRYSNGYYAEAEKTARRLKIGIWEGR